MEKFTEDDLKAIIAWGSISYAFGFVTIMLHTARLGFPVLELLQAVYIWIGLPLTLVAFFSMRIIRFLKKKAGDHAKALSESWQQLRADVAPADLDVVSSFLGVLVVILPGLNLIPQQAIRLLRIPFDRLLNREGEESPAAAQRAKLWLHRFVGFIKGMEAFFGFIRLFNIALIIAVGLYAYVWHLYPIIPQSYGGGAPSKVKLLVNTEKIPNNCPGIEAISPDVKNGKQPKVVLTNELELLYKSKDQYYLKGNKGVLVSLSKNTIEGVIWSPSK